MRKIVGLAISLFTFIAMFSVANGCALSAYQPEIPEHLR